MGKQAQRECREGASWLVSHEDQEMMQTSDLQTLELCLVNSLCSNHKYSSGLGGQQRTVFITSTFPSPRLTDAVILPVNFICLMSCIVTNKGGRLIYNFSLIIYFTYLLLFSSLNPLLQFQNSIAGLSSLDQKNIFFFFFHQQNVEEEIHFQKLRL